MSTMTAPKRTPVELLHVEECDAWFDYLAATHLQPEPRYEEVEPWAWSKLQARLHAITARRARLA